MVETAAKPAAGARLQAKPSLSELGGPVQLSGQTEDSPLVVQPPPDTELFLRELGSERRSFGYWRPFILLRRQGSIGFTGPCRVDSTIDWHFITPGEPIQNALVESFTGRMRDEFLSETLFFGPRRYWAQAPAWVAYYNNERPQSSLRFQTSRAYAANLTAKGERLRDPDQLRQSLVAPPAPLGIVTLDFSRPGKQAHRQCVH